MTSFSCFLASAAASFGVSTKSIFVPYPQVVSPAAAGAASSATAATPNSERLMKHLLHAVPAGGAARAGRRLAPIVPPVRRGRRPPSCRPLHGRYLLEGVFRGQVTENIGHGHAKNECPRSGKPDPRSCPCQCPCPCPILLLSFAFCYPFGFSS